MANTDQFIEGIDEIFSAAEERFKKGEDVEEKDRVPLTNDIPLESNTWWKIKDVICVFIDMKNSTQLSVQTKDKFAAGIYQYFTDTAVRILDYFGASYIDVRGDGAFGLFDSNKLYHAFASAETFRTFVEVELNGQVHKSDDDPIIACHIGMDKKTVLVKRIGLRRVDGKNDKQNEVWAGKPVNMASKLASLGGANEIMVSDRIFNIFKKDNSDLVLKSCGCNASGQKTDLWAPVDLSSQPFFDFSIAYKLKVPWCGTHGGDFCEGILKLD